MTDRIKVVLEGLRDVLSSARGQERGVISPQIAYLLGAINATGSADERSQYLSHLAIEYQNSDLVELAERALKAAVEATPSEPLSRIGIASFLLIQDRPSEARDAAISAVEVAERSGRFRRHALQTLARAFGALREYQELSRVMRKLIELKVSGPDAQIENDFLRDLPHGSIDVGLIRQCEARVA